MGRYELLEEGTKYLYSKCSSSPTDYRLLYLAGQRPLVRHGTVSYDVSLNGLCQRSPEQHVAPSVQERSRHHASGGSNPRRERHAPVSPSYLRKLALFKPEAVSAHCRVEPGPTAGQ
jgi:hypothetical protein